MVRGRTADAEGLPAGRATDGVTIRELAEFLGHHDPAFTMRVYSRMQPGSHDRARNAMDQRMFRPRAVS